MLDDRPERSTCQLRALEHASFCRELADRTFEKGLRKAILRTATICEKYALRLGQAGDAREPKLRWVADWRPVFLTNRRV